MLLNTRSSNLSKCRTGQFFHQSYHQHTNKPPKYQNQYVKDNIKCFKSRFRSPLEGSTACANYRSRIFKSNSTRRIHKILLSNSRNDFDITVYNAAIQKSGYLGDIDYCLRIKKFAETRNIMPNKVMFSQLFQAFNVNGLSLLDDRYLSIFEEMINNYKGIVNEIIATQLLGACVQTGNIEVAQMIWNLILKQNIKLNEIVYSQMIRIYGQNGDCDKSREFYDEMSRRLGPAGVISRNIMMQSYLKNNQLENAKQIKSDMQNSGQQLDRARSISCVNSQMYRYVQIQKNAKFNDFRTTCGVFEIVGNRERKDRKKHFFELVINLPRKRLSNGLTKWNGSTAGIVLEAYLCYYNYGNMDKIVEFFETMCNGGHLGYWIFDQGTGQWVIDLHGYNYNQITFVLKYILDRKCDELINFMEYDWKIMCGQRSKTTPSSIKSESHLGIGEFIMKRLLKKYQIDCSIDPSNPGQLLLNTDDISKFVERKGQLLTGQRYRNTLF